MKRIISALLVLITLVCVAVVPASAQEAYPIKREQLHVRDPYVLLHDGKYYMYGTGLSQGEGYGCVVSEDLENWSERIQVFSPDENFDGCMDYWAPECHYYKGNFYLFATYRSQLTNKRGTAVFKSESPTGPFSLLSDGHITPKEIDCIDGTLYVDENGQPWMVYVNEWTSTPDGIGEMAVAKLSDDLSHFVSEPKTIFRADGHLWTDNNVTDGPFLYKTSKGRLVMLWSNAARSGGYAVGMAMSDNGKIDGNWIHHPTAVYKETKKQYDGGHPMLFKTKEGKMMMAIHSPNSIEGNVFEHAEFFEMEDTGKLVRIAKNGFLTGVADIFRKVFNGIYFFVLKVYAAVFM